VVEPPVGTDVFPLMEALTEEAVTLTGEEVTAPQLPVATTE
jgi:hypothetical protein